MAYISWTLLSLHLCFRATPLLLQSPSLVELLSTGCQSPIFVSVLGADDIWFAYDIQASEYVMNSILLMGLRMAETCFGGVGVGGMRGKKH
ncbi:hypothetical protein MRB53_009439 [Persea americana]|uniref:Uncharacterized protein n=1 Tax=Persea americana TaxID=3435 RepID=A0ACC2LP06_PERAE|nr:hypothetical protein MRB53_009439 [Persea americana]